MENNKIINGANKFHPKDFPHAMLADIVLCCIACSEDPYGMDMDTLIKQCDKNRNSVYQKLLQLEKMHVLTRSATRKFKLVNLNIYEHVSKRQTHIRTMLHKLRVTLPPNVLSPEGIVTTLPVLENNVQPINTSRVRGVSEGEGRLKDYVTEFLQSVRSKLDRFEENLANKNY